MSKEYEIFETLDLNSQTEAIKFKDVDNRNYLEYSGRESEIDFTFLSIEIQSSLPPTDCKLLITYYTQSSNTVKDLEINCMKFRRHFIYENGLYILYFEDIKEIEFPKDIIPMKVNFENKRDPKAVAKLFYRTNFRGRQW